ncbi:MAG TPA: IclR family transcriptional regulator [Aliidongia sp.]|uniref:IclR family transcriptional regulator n=1 Tax=Aliidongia sp. TaxID=1914230 RepID=UPI002DDD15BC|nr:IclR family transcriptional regulator [Aliidongia sp.]HEV2678743.1 IclR family transcriptional regulator [Aliidongia sp.]
MKPDSAVPVKSADRAFDILECVGAAPEPPSFSQLMAGLGIPRSSLFHLLNNLLSRGYLEQEGASGCYRLGPSVRKLAERIAGPSLAVLVQPFLLRLSAELNETSGFYVRMGDMVETVASAASSQALAYTMRVGERAPLYAVSAGKILLAQLSASALQAYLARVAFEPITPATLRAIQPLRDQVAAARDDGFAYSREEFTPGITGIATAVRYEGRLFGALNLAVPTARATPERDAAFRRELRSIAMALGLALGTGARAG